MPKPGFKSFTVTDLVYDNFFQTWQKCKQDLAMKGVTSFSGYITHQINECMRVDKIITKHKQRFEKISIEDCRIVLKDNGINRIIELDRDGAELFCKFCDRNNCRHVGFGYSLYEIYRK